MAIEVTTTEETENDGTVTSEDVTAAREAVAGIEQADNQDVRGDGGRLSRGTTQWPPDDHDGRAKKAETRGRDNKCLTSKWLRTVATLCHRTSGAGTGSSKQPDPETGDVCRRDDEQDVKQHARCVTTYLAGLNSGRLCHLGAGNGSSKQTTETSGDGRGTFCRGVAERGGYAVSSGCTSGAGTGSSKQTTETSEETETFCRGYHYGNGHRDDHDGGNGNDGDSDERGRESLGTRRRRRARSVAERGGYAVSSGCTSGAGTDRASRQPRRPRRRRRFVEGTTTEMATEMTTTEETENDGDSDERDVRAWAREDVSGDVTRSVAERGDYAVSSGCTSGAGTDRASRQIETSEETETFCRGDERGRESLGTRRREWRRPAVWLNAVLRCVIWLYEWRGHGIEQADNRDVRGDGDVLSRTVTSEDVRALAREDVSGDVARSVAERGGYAVSSGCTSGAGTGSSKQTTETSEETETFCRGKRKTTETVTSEDVRALAREDVSGDVARSVAERGGYAVSSGCTSGAGTDRASRQPRRPRRRRRFVEGTTTEMATEMTTTEETENDGDSDERGHVSGDVARSVAERGGYAVSSGCTSGAGTGSSKQTTETSEETETFCRGKRKTTETVTSEDVRALAREDVSGDVTRSVAERGGYAVSSGCTSGAGTDRASRQPRRPRRRRRFVEGTTTEMATEMTTTEETENDGDSDERGRESLGTRRREWRRDPQCG
ncbi:hypothetical protein GN244_ATG19605 [Phytophthora infestans]|uniref:Uncharacterized protein n=1 Tax=Phytophthora infestans TaxID=4787 RepID=A0A833SUH7_PHYIN|nr:hypothetical protein GN244_ATG19605 [Phytophthora infestans]